MKFPGNLKIIANSKKNIIISLFFILILYFLFSSGVINTFFVGKAFSEKGSSEFFVDWKTIIRWLECNSVGSEIYAICKAFNYGKIILLLPYSKNLEIFYFIYLPTITIAIFIISVTFLINPRNIIQFIVLFLAIFNPSTLTLLERMNLDIFIFLILIIMSLNRIYVINWILFSFAFLTKIYPVVLGIIIFVENKLRKKISLIVILVSILVLLMTYIFIYQQDIFSLNRYGVGVKAGYFLLFSLNATPKIIKYVFDFNYILSLIIIYIPFFISLYFIIKFFNKRNIKNYIDIYSFEEKLFLLGANMLVLCYIFFSNYYYREIFLISLLPLFFKLINKYNIKYVNYVIYFIIFRFIFLFIYGYIHIDTQNLVYHTNGIRYFTNIFLITATLKSLIDFVLMSFIGSLVLLMNYVVVVDLVSKYKKKGPEFKSGPF